MLSASADPRALGRALETLRRAFDCDGVALHAFGPGGAIEPWCARGQWQIPAGDLRDCVSMPLLRGRERIGTLDLLGRPGQRWTPAQLGLIRTASGALGAALGARFELERLRRQPGRDTVTGLPDERAFNARLAEELSRARRHGLPLALATVELDHFAALRERYGPEVADGVLAEASLVLKLALRDSDILARTLAGRFAALLPETQSTPAVRCADRLRRTLEDHRFARVGRVSATAAVATSPRDGLETIELLEAVARALAVARKSGRRRVASPSPLHLQ
jgi:diguanylate cyclase (GGDEF)-like protein